MLIVRFVAFFFLLPLLPSVAASLPARPPCSSLARPPARPRPPVRLCARAQLEAVDEDVLRAMTSVSEVQREFTGMDFANVSAASAPALQSIRFAGASNDYKFAIGQGEASTYASTEEYERSCSLCGADTRDVPALTFSLSVRYTDPALDAAMVRRGRGGQRRVEWGRGGVWCGVVRGVGQRGAA